MQSDKKSLCILVNQFIVGGIERVVIDAMPSLAKNYNLTLFIVTDYVDDTFLGKAQKYARVIRGAKHYSKAEFVASQLPHSGGMMLRRMIGEHYEVLIVTSPYSLPASYAKIADKTVYWYHGNKDIMYESNELSFIKRLNKIRLRKLYSRYDQVWALNERINDGITKAFKLKNTRILPNPIDCSQIIEKAKSDSCRDLYPDNAVNVAVVGRLSYEKGIMRVINALSAMKPEDKNICLHVIGDGPERENLETASAALNNVTVLFHGQKENPYPYIRMSDVLICPSYHESFGVVMLEAMILKVPVITTATVGGMSVTDNGKYGLLADNSDDALEKIISAYLKNPEIGRKFVDPAYDYAKKFDVKEFDKLMEKYLLT